MRLLRLIWANCRRLLAQPVTIVFLIALPVGILLFQNMLMTGSGAAGSGILLHNQDRGGYAQSVIERSELSFDTVQDTQNPFAQLENYSADLLYVFPEDFSEKMEAGKVPVVERYARDDTALFANYDALLEQGIKEEFLATTFQRTGIMTAEEFLHESTVQTKVSIADYEVSFVYVFTMLMIVYFIMLFSSSTGTDLLELREQKVTSRMFVTPNHSFEIMVALALGYFLLTFISYSVVVTVARFVFDMKEFPLGMTLLIVGLMSLFSLSLSLFTAKITKNRTVIQLIPTLYGILGFFTTIYGLLERTDSGIIAKAAYATPIYWVKEMIIHGDILKNTSIILLMSLVLLTAGSYNLRAFVED